MQARMKHPVFVIPNALKAMQALHSATADRGVPQTTFDLVYLRASQVNGCGVCVDLHARDLNKAGESFERIASVGAWRETPYYTDAERAALALTEHVTRLADRPDPVPDDVWAEAARHYDEQALSALLLAIGSINVWNRLNAATKQMAGDWVG